MLAGWWVISLELSDLRAWYVHLGVQCPAVCIDLCGLNESNGLPIEERIDVDENCALFV